MECSKKTLALPGKPPMLLKPRGMLRSYRLQGLVEASIAIAPEELRGEMAGNVGMKRWRTKPEDSDEKNAPLFMSMMRDRHPVLALIDWEFRLLCREVGWDRRTVRAAADALVPLIDLTERQCFTFYGHEHRAMRYGTMLLESRGVRGQERAEILLGILMHDIGKSVVSGDTLSKADKPEVYEQEILDGHPVFGHAIVSTAIEDLRRRGFRIGPEGDRIANIVRWHHERYDGRGYPDKLAGDGIPIGARLAGFCDSFDTMTSVRPYRLDPMCLYRNEREFGAVQESKANLNTQFNGGIVNDFLAVIGRWQDTVLDIMCAARGTCGKAGRESALGQPQKEG